MYCIGSRQHRWNLAVYTNRDSARRECLRCGMTGRQWQLAKDDWWHREVHGMGISHPCPWGEGRLRRQAWHEQAGIRAALKADEAEVLALYGRKDDAHNRMYFLFRTPPKMREEYPQWVQQRAQQMETARQRALLRQGHQTLKDIRQRLRNPGRSQQPESRPARTSPT